MNFEPFLRKSPDASELTVEHLGRPDSTVSAKSTDSKPGSASQGSMIGIMSPSADQFDELSMSGDFTELALPMPPPVRKKKRSSGKKKSKRSDVNWPVVTTLGAGLAAVILLSIVFFAGDAESVTVSPSTSPGVRILKTSSRTRPMMNGATSPVDYVRTRR